MLAAVDLGDGAQPLRGALRLTVRRVLQTEQSTRLVCVNVLKLVCVALDELSERS